jgi:peroxiredoxin 2/4
MFNILKINSKAPEFDLKGSHNGEFKTYKSSDFLGKWLVLFFYPSDFTTVCPTEVVGFHRAISEFQTRNTEIIGCSVDSVNVHKAWAESLGGVDYPLLADVHHSTCIDYNVFIDDEARALRGTFIIDPEGLLKWYQISDNSVGRSVEEVLRVIDAIQSGKLCPLGWQKGDKTLN